MIAGLKIWKARLGIAGAFLVGCSGIIQRALTLLLTTAERESGCLIASASSKKGGEMGKEVSASLK